MAPRRGPPHSSATQTETFDRNDFVLATRDGSALARPLLDVKISGSSPATGRKRHHDRGKAAPRNSSSVPRTLPEAPDASQEGPVTLLTRRSAPSAEAAKESDGTDLKPSKDEDAVAPPAVSAEGKPSGPARGGMLQVSAAAMQESISRDAPALRQKIPHAGPSSRAPRPMPNGRKGPGPRDGGHRSRHDHLFDRGEGDRRSEAGFSDDQQQQLFDPRRHNAINFSKTVSTASEGRSTAAPSSTAPTSVAPSIASNDSRERRRRKGPPSDASGPQRSRDGSSKADSSRSADTSGYVAELKRNYRDICQLETKLKEEHKAASERKAILANGVDGLGLQLLTAATSDAEHKADGTVDHSYWTRLIDRHRRLADMHVVFFDHALRPGLPSSIHTLPSDYDLPSRLWQTGFHLLIERIRLSFPFPCGPSPDETVGEAEKTMQFALVDHLTDFIYHAYNLYTNLLESDHLRVFKTFWMEGLGDLARYRMVVAGLNASFGSAIAMGGIRNKSPRLLEEAVPELGKQGSKPSGEDDPQDRASIGSAALGDWELEEKETWRTTARDWYAKGLAELPGTGKLHHHLAVLSRHEDLRALHHFCKSLTTSHAFGSAKETLLCFLFDGEQQARRIAPDAGALDLFVHLHGIIFTKVQLDDFAAVLARFEVALKSELDRDDSEIGSATLMMLATANIAALMQYGAEEALLGTHQPPLSQSSNASVEESTTATVATVKEPDTVDEDADLPPSSAPADGTDIEQASSAEDEKAIPVALQCAMRLTATVLDLLAITSAAPSPYITMVLTLLFRYAKMGSSARNTGLPRQIAMVERYLPWDAFVRLAAARPDLVKTDSPQKLSTSPPLPEDWCLRGLSWTGRKVFEKDFWKSPSRSSASGWDSPSAVDERADGDAFVFESEVAVLDMDETGRGQVSQALKQLRWERIGVALSALAEVVPGLDLEESTGIVIAEPLISKMTQWKYEDEHDQVEQQIKRLNVNSFLGREDSAIALADIESVDLSDDLNAENETEELAQLKHRRRELRQQLEDARSTTVSLPLRNPPVPSAATSGPKPIPDISHASFAVPGYTTLVFDTNILLSPSSAEVFRQLVDSKAWTLVLPLAIVTELEGLRRKRPEPVGERAEEMILWLEHQIKLPGATKWLKVQTSKGNFLTDLSCRSEEIDFKSSAATSGGTEKHQSSSEEKRQVRTLDEIILRCYLHQLSNWMDRRGLMGKSLDNASSRQVTDKTPKALMVTSDRGLRLRVKGKGGKAIGREEFETLAKV